ncbi:MAG: cob(I)yrinic acid a,c-diamide adenosyltransferase [Bacilli bacterium]
MKIYTKTGDEGQTSLIHGRRVGKDDHRVETYGTLDEANSVLGIVAASLRSHGAVMDDIGKIIARVQRDLFDLGRDLATPADGQSAGFVTPAHVEQLERVIDRLDAETPPLRQFILPGGDLAACHLHHARTVVRRAERLCVGLLRGQTANAEIRRYLNRLSDLLFVCARVVNFRLAVAEPAVDFLAPPEDIA